MGQEFSDQASESEFVEKLDGIRRHFVYNNELKYKDLQIYISFFSLVNLPKSCEILKYKCKLFLKFIKNEIPVNKYPVNTCFTTWSAIRPEAPRSPTGSPAKRLNHRNVSREGHLNSKNPPPKEASTNVHASILLVFQQ